MVKRVFSLLPKVALKQALDVYRRKVILELKESLDLNLREGWSYSDVVARRFQVYEEHFVSLVLRHPEQDTLFIDLGGADGYYLDLAKTNDNFTNFIVSELDSMRREELSRAYKKELKNLTVFGDATDIDFSHLVKDHKSVFLICDIEGAEYEIFDKIFSMLVNSVKFVAIVELHKVNLHHEQVELFSERICKNIPKVNVSHYKRKNYTVPDELLDLPTDQQLLLISENRESFNSWLEISNLDSQ